MKEFDVIVIGGGMTGIGVLRDLSMRGVRTLLLEQKDYTFGASSRFHGLLHSGGRYAVTDPEAARECIMENTILRRIAAPAVEETGGLFVRTPGDPAEFEDSWIQACGGAGIAIENVPLHEAFRLEPRLARDIVSVWRVPDATVDGFRLAAHNLSSARRYGGEALNYTRVNGFIFRGGRIAGVHTVHTLTGEETSFACRVVVNARHSADRLTLEVRDAGRGMDRNARRGVGTHSMRERAEDVGGSVAITGAQPHGTVVTAHLPWGPS